MASGAGALVLAAVAVTSIHSARSLQAIVNYAEMAQDNQLALDQLSQTIRGAERVSAYTSNSLTIVVAGTNMTFTHLPFSQILQRSHRGTNTTILSNVTAFSVFPFQRNVISNSFNQFLASNATNTKAVIVEWTVRDSIPNQVQTETTHSARIVVRNNP